MAVSLVRRDGGNGSGGGDSSVIFAFLIIFLGLFGTFLFGGLVWHYMKARRHAMLVEALVRYEHAKNWGSGVPEMYEIRVAAPGSGTPAVDPWDAFVPIAGRLTDTHLRPAPPAPPNPMDDVLAADLSNWGILKWAAGASATWTRNQLRRVGHTRPPAASCLPSPRNEDFGAAAIDAVPLPVDEDAVIDVAVMIAMPSPPRQRPASAAGTEEEVLGEYVVGVTRLLYRHERS